MKIVISLEFVCHSLTIFPYIVLEQVEHYQKQENSLQLKVQDLQENVAQYQVRDISSKKNMRLFLL